MTYTKTRRPVDRRPQAEEQNGQIVTGRQLSRLSGVSVTAIASLAKSEMIPPPIGYDQNIPLYDLADPELAAWVKALQDAGYNRGR